MHVDDKKRETLGISEERKKRKRERERERERESGSAGASWKVNYTSTLIKGRRY